MSIGIPIDFQVATQKALSDINQALTAITKESQTLNQTTIEGSNRASDALGAQLLVLEAITQQTKFLEQITANEAKQAEIAAKNAELAAARRVAAEEAKNKRIEENQQKAAKKEEENKEKEVKKAEETAKKVEKIEQDKNKKIAENREKLLDKSNENTIVGLQNLGASFQSLFTAIANGQIPLEEFKSVITNIGATFGPPGVAIAEFVNLLIGIPEAAFNAAEGLFKLTENAGEGQRQLDLLARTTGLLPETIAGLRKAAESIGASFVQVLSVADLLAERTNSLLEGRNSDRLEKTFGALGFTIDDVAKKSANFNDFLVETIRRFANLDAGTRKAAIGYELFGVRAQKVADQIANIGIDKFIEEIRQSNVVLSEQLANGLRNFNEQLLNIQVKFEGLKQLIGAELAPTFTEFLRAANEAFDALKADQNVQAGFAALLEVVKAFIEVLSGEGVEIIKTFIGITGEFLNGLNNIFSQAKLNITDLKDAINGVVDTLKKVTGIESLEKLVNILQFANKLNRERAESVDKATEAIKKQNEAATSSVEQAKKQAEESLKLAQARLAEAQAIKEQTDKNKEATKETLSAIEATKKQTEEINKQVEALNEQTLKIKDQTPSLKTLKQESEEYGVVVQKLKGEVKELTSAYENNVKSLENLAARQKETINKDVENGIKSASDAAKEIAEIDKKLFEDKKLLAEQQLKDLQDREEKGLDLEKEISKAKVDLEKITNDELKQLADDLEKFRSAKLNERLAAERIAQNERLAIVAQQRAEIDLEEEKTKKAEDATQKRNKLAIDELNNQVKFIQTILKEEDLSAKERLRLEQDLSSKKLELARLVESTTKDLISARKKDTSEAAQIEKANLREIAKEEKTTRQDQIREVKNYTKNASAEFDLLKERYKLLLKLQSEELKKNGASDLEVLTFTINSEIKLIENEIASLRKRNEELSKPIAGSKVDNTAEITKNNQKIVELFGQGNDLLKKQDEAVNGVKNTSTGLLDVQDRSVELINKSNEGYRKTSQALAAIGAATKPIEDTLARIAELGKFDAFEATNNGVKKFLDNADELQKIIDEQQRLFKEGKNDIEIGGAILEFAQKQLAELQANTRAELERQAFQFIQNTNKKTIEEFNRIQDELLDLQKSFNDRRAQAELEYTRAIRRINQQAKKDEEKEQQQREDLITAGNKRLNDEIASQNEQADERERQRKNEKLQDELNFQKEIIEINKRAIDDKFKQLLDQTKIELGFARERKLANEELDKAKKAKDANAVKAAQDKLADIDKREKSSSELQDKLKALEAEREKRRQDLIEKAKQDRAKAGSAEERARIDKELNEKLGLLDDEIEQRKNLEKQFDEFKDVLTEEQKQKLKQALADSLAAKAKALADELEIDRQLSKNKEDIRLENEAKEAAARQKRLDDIREDNKKELDEFDQRVRDRQQKVIDEIADEKKKRDRLIIQIRDAEVEAIDAVQEKYKTLFGTVNKGVGDNITTFEDLFSILKQVEDKTIIITDLFSSLGKAIQAGFNPTGGANQSTSSRVNGGTSNVSSGSGNGNNGGIPGFNITVPTSQQPPSSAAGSSQSPSQPPGPAQPNNNSKPAGQGNGNRDNINNKFGKPITTISKGKAGTFNKNFGKPGSGTGNGLTDNEDNTFNSDNSNNDFTNTKPENVDSDTTGKDFKNKDNKPKGKPANTPPIKDKGGKGATKDGNSSGNSGSDNGNGSNNNDSKILKVNVNIDIKQIVNNTFTGTQEVQLQQLEKRLRQSNIQLIKELIDKIKNNEILSSFGTVDSVQVSGLSF